jgi:hypothetical protein
MKTVATFLAAAFAATGSGCVRINPLYGGPSYRFREQAKDGQLNKINEGTLDPQGNDAFAQGFRFELPAAGALIVSAKPSNANAQLNIDVYGDGNVPLASTAQQADKKLTVQDLQPGTYYVVVHTSWRGGEQTRFKLNPIFKPQEPDAAQTVCKTQATARELPADKGSVEDAVDYSAQRRTCYWKIPLAAEGELAVKFDPQGANISAELVPPQGAPEKIDPVAGLIKKDAPPGDYFVKVFANEAGDAGRYRLQTGFKQGDTCKNGGPACSLEGAEELKLPSDSKTADVDYAKSKQFHFYKANFKEKGKLTITFKVLQPPRGSKVAAYIMRNADDEGEKISGAAVTKDIDNPGEVYIRVQAPEQGDYGKYAISTIFQPNNFIPGDVVEIQKAGGCMLTVSAGTNQGVRAGLGCTVVNAQGQVLDSCAVDQSFPNLSKVKPMNPRCNVPPNSKVQINAQ